MGEGLQDIDSYADPVAAMSRALSAGDERAFRAALSSFDTVRDGEVLTGIRKVAVDLQSALQRFEIDSRLIGLAQREVPDARRRLAHVLKLTADAAHQTMDLVEQCCPLADQTLREAERLLGSQAVPPAALAADVTVFLRQAATDMTAVRGRLAEVRLAQGYQDLSGQIIRSVMDLVDELERALGELVRLADYGDAVKTAELSTRALQGHTRGMQGPVVPGIDHGDAVSGQQDVDALLSDLGM
ncbi:MAG TPA: protein phosphatase CheZ [Steroidobacteraceae bacterium]|nr:protein phosphatase CheZ [Steroidobacteraceae bacterium]